jgi:uncharacterized membrane protein YfcA
MLIIAYVFLGLLSGLVGGLFGIGGGVIVVPALAFLFSYAGMPKESLMHIAIGTSLATTSINSLFSSYLHSRHNGISWGFLRQILPGLVIGALCGSFLTTILSSRYLEIFFALFAFWVGIRFLKKTSHTSNLTVKLSFLQISAIGLCVAVFSNLVGIGGGIFMIPLFTFLRFPTPKVIGTSASVSFLISIFGTIFFLYKGGSALINWHTFCWIAFGSLFSIAYGVYLTRSLPYRIISIIFAFLMLCTGFIMLIGK